MAVPASPKDRKAIKAQIKEISEAMTMMEDRRSYINDVKKELKDEYDLETAGINVMIKAMHKQCIVELGEYQADAEAILDA